MAQHQKQTSDSPYEIGSKRDDTRDPVLVRGDKFKWKAFFPFDLQIEMAVECRRK
jgi:hypothetical protein